MKADSVFHKHHKVYGQQHVEVIESMTERTFKYPKMDHEKVLVLKVTGLNEDEMNPLSTNMHPISFYGNYFEESVKELEKNMKVEECIVGRKKGYKVAMEENDKINTVYIVQEKDMFFEIILNFRSSRVSFSLYFSNVRVVRKKETRFSVTS